MVFKRVSIGILILVIVVVGAGILISSTSEENGAVYGFTDQICNLGYRSFQSMDEMDEYSDDPSNGWEYNSYVKLSNPNKCVEVVRKRVEQPEE